MPHKRRLIRIQWADHYLPVPCPVCDRLRLLYANNVDSGGVVAAECEKCGMTWGVIEPNHPADVVEGFWLRPSQEVPYRASQRLVGDQ